MENFWLSVADQIPALAVILLFLIYERRIQQASVERNHTMWQAWLVKRDEASAEERRVWQEWIRDRDMLRTEEHRQLIESLASLQAEIRTMSKMVLMRYAVTDPERAKEIIETMERGKAP